MIVIDPEFDPEPAATVKKSPTTLVPRTTDRTMRLPSERTLSRFLIAAQAAVRLRGQVNVMLTTDSTMRALNRRFRGKNKTTDVLSFPAAGPAAREVVGDLAISVPTALRQATEQGHRLSIEIKVLILHGLLHLAGLDHEADEGQMERRERMLRARLRLPQGLIERAGARQKSASKPAKQQRPAAKRSAAKHPMRGTRP